MQQRFRRSVDFCSLFSAPRNAADCIFGAHLSDQVSGSGAVWRSHSFYVILSAAVFQA
jgi:hypothetical protein